MTLVMVTAADRMPCEEAYAVCMLLSMYGIGYGGAFSHSL